jgi:hypothetical protein
VPFVHSCQCHPRLHVAGCIWTDVIECDVIAILGETERDATSETLGGSSDERNAFGDRHDGVSLG